jgi:hypothetical protein
VTVWSDLAELVPDAHAGAGAEVDVGGLAIFARLAAGIEKSNELAEQRRKERAIPGNGELGANALYPSSGNLILDLGSCPIGRVWQIRRIVIGGLKCTDTPTGSAFLFVQGNPPADLNTSGVVDSWPSFAQGAQGSTYGAHELWMEGGDHLFVVITGGTSTNPWTAKAKVEDYDQAAYSALAIVE